MLADKLKTEKVTLEAKELMENARSNCSDPQLFFGSLGVLLGFPNNTAIQANTETESHSKVEINRATAMLR